MANLYDLKKFDLNLLVIFECIYENLSISKAAETLYITPSAVSQSLQRLRLQFNDPLFVRAGKGISPTIVGINLHHHLGKNLDGLEQIINIMNASEFKNKFVIYGPQLISTFNVSRLITCLREEASVEIEYHDILTSTETGEELLAHRKADLVVTMLPMINRSVLCMPFQTISNVLVCRNNHPRIKNECSLDDILKEEFTMLMSEAPGLDEYQSRMDKIMANRKIAFRSQSLISIINIIAETDIIGIIPQKLYEMYRSILNLREIKIDYTLPLMRLYISYNKTSLYNKAFSNFITRIADEKQSSQKSIHSTDN